MFIINFLVSGWAQDMNVESSATLAGRARTWWCAYVALHIDNNLSLICTVWAWGTFFVLSNDSFDSTNFYLCFETFQKNVHNVRVSGHPFKKQLMLFIRLRKIFTNHNSSKFELIDCVHRYENERKKSSSSMGLTTWIFQRIVQQQNLLILDCLLYQTYIVIVAVAWHASTNHQKNCSDANKVLSIDWELLMVQERLAEWYHHNSTAVYSYYYQFSQFTLAWMCTRISVDRIQHPPKRQSIQQRART